MIAKLAVSAANFAIDKPYSYRIPESMALRPGQRVIVPFGRGNRRCEGVVLAVEPGDQENLKSIEQSLDEEPVVSEYLLRLAAFVRERYFCTFYDAIRTMLPAGLWIQTKATFSLTEEELAVLLRNGVDACFASDAVKSELIQVLDKLAN